MSLRRNLLVAVAMVVGLSIGTAVALRFGNRNDPAPPPGQPQDAVGDASTNQQSSDSSGAPARIRGWRSVVDLDKDVAVFESVFWDARDTHSLRKLIREELPLRGKTVLEIGTGSGLLALCCLQAGADRVVATDVNRAAVENAIYNAHHLAVADRLDARLVPLDDASAFSVIGIQERFDFIVSNPPWVDEEPQTIEQYALYDANFSLMRSLIAGLRQHLNPGGRVFLAYGSVDAVKTLQRLARANHYEFTIHDDRRLDDLPAEFLPGMLIEIRLSAE